MLTLGFDVDILAVRCIEMNNKKLLLGLVFWDGDKDMAMKVARLIADLQPEISDEADFLFMARFDCPQDQETIRYVSRKFNTHFATNRRRGVGWPHGCNDLWFGMMDWIYSYRQADRIPDYKAVLSFEADSCPLSPDWIKAVSQAWDKAKVTTYGPLVENPVHVNGNRLSSCDMEFLHWISREVGGCTPQAGWDYILHDEFVKKGLKDAKEMRSWWNTPTITKPVYDKLLRQGVKFLHGCKDDSVIQHVRTKFNI